MAWWHHRKRFLQVAQERGLTRNPIARGLDAAEALELLGMSLCEAVYHDLEKSTGVNVWTFAQNLAGGWFDRGGDWAPLRAMFDILGTSARTVVDEIRAAEGGLGFLLDVAVVSRALVVAELALGGLLADRLRHVDGELIALHGAMQETIDTMTTADERSERRALRRAADDPVHAARAADDEPRRHQHGDDQRDREGVDHRARAHAATRGDGQGGAQRARSRSRATTAASSPAPCSRRARCTACALSTTPASCRCSMRSITRAS